MKASSPFRYLSPPALALVAFLIVGTLAYSQEVTPGYPQNMFEYDPREVAMLPNYCASTWGYRDHVPGGNNPHEIERWRSMMGATFEGLHHYCWGLMRTNRALLLSRNRTTRSFYLQSSIGEFDYVINIAPKDFVLLPEILTKKGENLIALGNSDQGIGQLLRAIELKPDYWPPYAIISDFYKINGNRQKAREFLEKGLSSSPDATALKRRLAELDTAKRVRESSPQAVQGK